MKGKTGKGALALVLALSIAAAGIPVLAVSQAEIDELEAQRGELEEQQGSVQEQLLALQEEQGAFLERKSALDQQAELLRQDIVLITSQIKLYQQTVAEKKAEAEQAETAAKEHYEQYRARMRMMEEESIWSFLDFIFHSDSFTELLSRAEDISSILRADKRMQTAYLDARSRAREVLEEYEELLAAQEEKQRELTAQQKALDEKIKASAAILAELEKDIEAYQEYQDAVETEMAKVQQLIDEKAAALRRQQEAEAAAAAQPSVTLSSGYYMWPSSCTTITSPFGPRTHPIYGELKPHTGVDIGANYGTEIYAAAAGTVCLAVVDYGTVGYGTYVAIYHPNGTTTLYGHMSALSVSVGESVTQGQLIGYVGSTGASTGPHLHFEVRTNGACVDPMQYF